MAKIKAILFDLDGTLRDSREVVYPAVEHAVLTHTGKKPTRAELLPYIYHHDKIHEIFAKDTNKERFLKTYWDKIDELWGLVVEYEGVRPLLQTLKSEGYKLGIVSSAKTTVTYLKSVGTLKYFDVIIGDTDTVEHKPSPAPVILALSKLKAKNTEAILIGDLPADIQAATAAGIPTTIGITHGFGTEEQLKNAGATYIINSLNQLPGIVQEVLGGS